MRETITISQTAWLNLCLISQEVTCYCAASLSAILYLTLCHRVLKQERGREKKKKKPSPTLFSFQASNKRGPSPWHVHRPPLVWSACIDSSCCYPRSWMNYISLFHPSQWLLRSLSASSRSNRACTAKTCRPESYSDLIRLKIFTSRTLLFLMV